MTIIWRLRCKISMIVVFCRVSKWQQNEVILGHQRSCGDSTVHHLKYNTWLRYNAIWWLITIERIRWLHKWSLQMTGTWKSQGDFIVTSPGWHKATVTMIYHESHEMTFIGIAIEIPYTYKKILIMCSIQAYCKN